MKKFNFWKSNSNKGSRDQKTGFTLIELLVVIAILALISSVALVSLDAARRRTRDTERLSNMNQIQRALQLYYEANGQFPAVTDNDCGGWDASFSGTDPFISNLQPVYFVSTPKDPSAEVSSCGSKGTANVYFYQAYSAGAQGCPVIKGDFYVLGIRNAEAVNLGDNHPQSPGFGPNQGCATNWQDSFEWVTGAFEP